MQFTIIQYDWVQKLTRALRNDIHKHISYYFGVAVNCEIKPQLPCFIAVITYGYEFGCVLIKERVR